MEVTRLSVIGIGSLRCGAPIIASLANYFGERPLEVCFYDADSELLDVFDRLARLCFTVNKTPHLLRSTDDFSEAVLDATHALFCVSENCARKHFKISANDPVDDLVPRAIAQWAPIVPSETTILSLIPEFPQDRPVRFLNWPPKLDEKARASHPHQLLRWIFEDDYLHDLLKEHIDNPIKGWLG